MTAPVTITTPAPAVEAKPGRKVADAAASGDFAAVLAAVAGAAVPAAAVPQTPAQPAAAGATDTDREDRGAEVLMPPAAGLTPGPFPADSRPGAVVTLPLSAAHVAPVRGEAATPAGPPVPAGSDITPIPAGTAANTVGPLPIAAAPVTVDSPATPAESDAPVASEASAPSPETVTAASGDNSAGRAPADAASARAQLAAEWGEGPVPRPDAPVRSPRVETPSEGRVPEWAQGVPGRPAVSESRSLPGGGPVAAKPEREAPETASPAVATPIVTGGPQAAAPVTAPTSVAGSAPAAAPAVVDQVVDVIKPLVRMEDGTDEVVLELRHADLGIVRVEVRVEHGVVHATLHAEQDSTADLLRQSLPDLRGALADAGLRPGDLGCGNGRHAGQDPGSQDRTAWGRDPDRQPGTPAEPALTHRAADPRRSLDVLL